MIDTLRLRAVSVKGDPLELYLPPPVPITSIISVLGRDETSGPFGTRLVLGASGFTSSSYTPYIGMKEQG